MSEYEKFKETIITDFSEENIENLYNQGHVFTRIGKGVMHQIKSVRIDLSKFELSSENKRILKKCEGLKIENNPIPYGDYSWEIGKMAKDFYDSRDADFSANKIKELITNSDKSNFNSLFSFVKGQMSNVKCSPIGFAICYQTSNILHYSYPFYSLSEPKDTGLGMMLKTIQMSQVNGQMFCYLGSLNKYKLQFKGVEVFDGENWQTDIEKAKGILN